MVPRPNRTTRAQERMQYGGFESTLYRPSAIRVVNERGENPESNLDITHFQ